MRFENCRQKLAGVVGSEVELSDEETVSVCDSVTGSVSLSVTVFPCKFVLESVVGLLSLPRHEPITAARAIRKKTTTPRNRRCAFFTYSPSLRLTRAQPQILPRFAAYAKTLVAVKHFSFL
jgi:hypothetical protein